MINWRLLIPHQQYQIVIILWIYQWICGVRGSCGRNRYYHKTGGKNLQPPSRLNLGSYLTSYLRRTILKSVLGPGQNLPYKLWIAPKLFQVIQCLHTVLSSWWKWSVGIKLGKPLWGEVLSSFQVHSSCTRCRRVVGQSCRICPFINGRKCHNNELEKKRTQLCSWQPLPFAHEHGQPSS